jgi:hypothetical protein
MFAEFSLDGLGLVEPSVGSVVSSVNRDFCGEIIAIDSDGLFAVECANGTRRLKRCIPPTRAQRLAYATAVACV